MTFIYILLHLFVPRFAFI